MHLRRATAGRRPPARSERTPVSRTLWCQRVKGVPGGGGGGCREDKVKGQLGTQVKDASFFALGNQSPGAAGRDPEWLGGPRELRGGGVAPASDAPS